MDHISHSKPAVLTIVDKQRVAHHRLTGKTTRSEIEMGHYRRTLQPIRLSELDLSRLPLVQADGIQYALLGEIAQKPGHVLVMDIDAGTLSVKASETLHLVPPSDICSS